MLDFNAHFAALDLLRDLDDRLRELQHPPLIVDRGRHQTQLASDQPEIRIVRRSNGQVGLTQPLETPSSS